MAFYRFHSNSSTEKMTNIGVKGTHGRADSSLKAQTMQPTKKRNFFFFWCITEIKFANFPFSRMQLSFLHLKDARRKKVLRHLDYQVF